MFSGVFIPYYRVCHAVFRFVDVCCCSNTVRHCMFAYGTGLSIQPMFRYHTIVKSIINCGCLLSPLYYWQDWSERFSIEIKFTLYVFFGVTISFSCAFAAVDLTSRLPNLFEVCISKFNKVLGRIFISHLNGWFYVSILVFHSCSLRIKTGNDGLDLVHPFPFYSSRWLLGSTTAWLLRLRILKHHILTLKHIGISMVI